MAINFCTIFLNANLRILFIIVYTAKLDQLNNIKTFFFLLIINQLKKLSLSFLLIYNLVSHF